MMPSRMALSALRAAAGSRLPLFGRWPITARHVEPSLIASPAGEPSERLLDTALQAVAAARSIDLQWLAQRDPSACANVWPGGWSDRDARRHPPVADAVLLAGHRAPQARPHVFRSLERHGARRLRLTGARSTSGRSPEHRVGSARCPRSHLNIQD